MPPEGGRVDILNEAALIIWDQANQIEHFIRRATFQSTAYDFGFLVPTPTRPELAEAKDEIFSQLASLTAARIEVRHVWPSFGCVGGAMMADFSASAPAVTVLERKRVGDFDATVLTANDSGKLAEWLREHAYAFSPTLEKWLEP